MVQQMSDLQLAEILDTEYSKLMQAQGNILVIKREIENRKKPVEQPKEEVK